MTPLTDDEAERVGRLFEAHRPFVESIARNHAPTRDDVPDVVQNVGVRMCQSLRGFRGDASITTWLYSVTVTTAIDLFRKERTHLYRPRLAIGSVVEIQVLREYRRSPAFDERSRDDDGRVPGTSYRTRRSATETATRAVDLNLMSDGGLDPEAELQRKQRGAAVRDAISRLTNPMYAQAMRDALDADDVSTVSRTTKWRARGQMRTLLDGDPRLA